MKRKKLIISLCIVLVVLIAGAFVVYAAAYDSASDPLVALSYITNVFKPAVDKDIKAVSDKVTAAETKIASLEKALAGGTFDPSEIEGRLDALEGADAEQAKEISTLKTQLNSAKADLEAAKTELSQLVSEKASKTDVEAISERIDAQTERVDALVNTYGALLETLLAERYPAEENYGYTTVSLKAGEKLVCEGDCSMMLRSGAGTYTFGTSGYDATAASEISNGETASAEHITVFEGGAQFEASEDGAVIMVKGEYTVE